MAETKTYTPQQVVGKIAETIKERLAKFEVQVQELKSRELQPREGVLAKHELCPLCGGPDRNGVCECLALKKNAVQGYAGDPMGGGGAGAGVPSSTGMGSTGGGGTQPMAMSEKRPTTQKDRDRKAQQHLDDKAHKADKRAIDHQSKVAQDDAKVSKKPWEKNAPMKKDYGSGVADTSSLSKHQMPSSSAAAVAPPKARPATPVAAVNHELGSFRSIAGLSPVPSAAPMPAKKFNIGAAGRGNPATATAAGTIASRTTAVLPNQVGGSGVGGKGPTLYTKSEMPELADPKVAVEKPVEGAKMPEAGKKIKAPGSGGKILRKDAAAMTKKPAEGAGVGGKQMPGKGGGDALKAAGAAEVGRMKAGAPAPARANVAQLRGKLNTIQAAKNPTHPEVASSLASIKAARPGAAAAPAKVAPAALPSEDVDVSEFDAGPAKQMVHPNVAAARATAKPQAMVPKPKMNADQAVAAMQGKSGGVGFLRGLIQKFANRGKSIQPTGPGMRPSPGITADQAVAQMKPHGVHGGGVTVPTDSSGGVRTIPGDQAGPPLKRAPMTRVRMAMPLRRSEMKPAAPKMNVRDTKDKMDTLFGGDPKPLHPSDKKPKAMSKGELALSKMGKCAGCSKAEHTGMCKGLSSLNHNRTILAVKPTRGKKSR